MWQRQADHLRRPIWGAGPDVRVTLVPGANILHRHDRHRSADYDRNWNREEYGYRGRRALEREDYQQGIQPRRLRKIGRQEPLDQKLAGIQ